MPKKLLTLLTSILQITAAVLLAIFVGIMLFSNTAREERVAGLAPIYNHAEYTHYKNNNPIVRLYTDGSFVCTGFVISRQYVMTAAHCLDYLKQEIAVYSSDSSFGTAGRVVGIADHMDQGLIEVSIFDNIRPVKVDFTGELSTVYALDVMTCGYPGGQIKELCTPAKLTGIHFFLRLGVGTLYKGMSGGPVYATNSAGERIVVAINSAVLQQYILVAPAVNFLHNMKLTVVQEVAGD